MRVRHGAVILGAGLAALLSVPASVLAAAPDASLIEAAKRGKLAEVQALLDGGADVNGADNKGRTALMESARTGKVEVVRALLKAGARPDAQDRDGWTAPMRAIMAAQARTLALLVGAGANLELQNRKGEDAFQIAVGYGTANVRPEILPILAKAGVDPDSHPVRGKPALVYATGSLQWKMVGGLLKAGADPDVKDQKGRPAIVLAADHSDLDAGVRSVAALVAGGANLNARDRKGRSALEYAVGISKPDYRKKAARANAAKVAYILASKGADYESVRAARHTCFENGYGLIDELIVKGVIKAGTPLPSAAGPSAPHRGAPLASPPDAPKFAGRWRSTQGQFTRYVYEKGKLYTVFGTSKHECTLGKGWISYVVSGQKVELDYRFLDADTIEYSDPSMPKWKMVQKRQK